MYFVLSTYEIATFNDNRLKAICPLISSSWHTQRFPANVPTVFRFHSVTFPPKTHRLYNCLFYNVICLLSFPLDRLKFNRLLPHDFYFFYFLMSLWPLHSLSIFIEGRASRLFFALLFQILWSINNSLDYIFLRDNRQEFVKEYIWGKWKTCLFSINWPKIWPPNAQGKQAYAAGFFWNS